MGVHIKANSFFIFNYMFQQCYFKHNNNEVTLIRRKIKFHNFASIIIVLSLVIKILEKINAKLRAKRYYSFTTFFKVKRSDKNFSLAVYFSL